MRKGSEEVLCLKAHTSDAGVAQPVEHLICNQRVRGSNPFASSRKRFSGNSGRFARISARSAIVRTHSIRKFFRQVAATARIPAVRFPKERCRNVGVFGSMSAGFWILAQVGEWLKPTDCKSVPPSEVRRFESSPVHHFC